MVLPKKIIQILIPPVTIPRSTVKPVLRDQPLLGDPFKNSQLFINYVKYHFEIAFVLKDHMCKICQISRERLYCIVKRQNSTLFFLSKKTNLPLLKVVINTITLILNLQYDLLNPCEKKS